MRGLVVPGRFEIPSDDHRPVKPLSRSALSAQEILVQPLPILADYIWIGGGTLGLILLIVIIVLVMRRA
jgi:hypothetical protein